MVAQAELSPMTAAPQSRLDRGVMRILRLVSLTILLPFDFFVQSG
jgi:hypothetical protein